MDKRTFMANGGYNNGTNDAKKGGISHQKAMALGQTLSQVIGSNPAKDFTQANIDMVNNAITHVVSQMTDYGKELQMMPNGKSSSYFRSNVDVNLYDEKYANEGNVFYLGKEDSPASFNDIQQKITFNLMSRVWKQNSGFTVGNLQNIAVHEIGGHKIKNVPGNGIKHLDAYYLQMNHPTWLQTTPVFKNEMLKSVQLIKNGQL